MAYDHCYSWGILLMFRAQDQIYLSDIKCSFEDPGRAWIPKFLSALVVLHPRMSSSNDQLLECVHYPHPVVWLWDSEALENSWNIIVFSTRFWWIRCLDLTDNLRVVLKTSKKQEKKKKKERWWNKAWDIMISPLSSLPGATSLKTKTKRHHLSWIGDHSNQQVY